MSIGIITLANIFFPNHAQKDMQVTDKSISYGKGGDSKSIFLENKKYIVTNRIFNNTKVGNIVSVKFSKLSSSDLHSLTNKEINYRNFGGNAVGQMVFCLVYIIGGFFMYLHLKEFNLLCIILVIFACIQISHFL